MNPDSVILTEIIDLKMTIIQQREEITRMRKQIDAMKPKPADDNAQHVDDRRPG